ncbi:Ribosome-recycling factor [Monoraphidium neglectum]|uniref:Ribosome-recycling factor, chloroplastic n=1 Tax=Monoraphidium neglectum TaxID=145388 RepID=A0A0D2NUJ9_9CHLO|nr:Ribosome-recycling factor [Monoraphidium neglectum]KIZ07771.1 Ribosome-recycling factor [Monoraphidium neglectum]|eukprot:XP_013906790.1 Ribosome-recycling factor [Monoraphidium neglectum]
MKKAINVVVENFNTMRTGRANPAILDKIMVDYYGVPTPLKSLASVAVPDASTLIVSPFDRSGLRDVEKAILESDIGINPNNDGEKIRLNIPPMTQDRRKELSKKVSKMGEDGKVAVRNVRKDAMKRLDKHDFPKDSRKDLEDSIQKITDRYVKAVDDLIKTKSEELMKV